MNKQVKRTSPLEILVGEGFWLSVGGIATTGIGFIFWMLLGAIVGSSPVGYATTAISIASLIAGVLNMGLRYAVLREVPVHRTEAFSAAIFLSIIFGIAGSSLLPIFSNLYEGFSPYIGLTYFLTLALLIGIPAAHSLIALQKARSYTILAVGSSLIRIPSALLFVSMGFGGFGLALSFFIHTLSGTILCTAYVIFIIGLSRPTVRSITRVLRVGVANYPLTISTILVSSSIVTLGLLTRDPSEVGIFYISLGLGTASGMFAHNIATVALPVLSGNNKIGHEFTNDALRLGLALTIPLTALLVLLPGPILSLIGPDFASRPIPLSIIALGMLFMGTLLVCISRLNSEKLYNKVALLGITQLVTLLSTLTVLTPLIGMEGAALAFTLSNVTPLIFSINRGEIIILSKAYIILGVILAPLYSLILLNFNWEYIAIFTIILSVLVIYISKFIRNDDISLIYRLFLNGIKKYSRKS